MGDCFVNNEQEADEMEQLVAGQSLGFERLKPQQMSTVYGGEWCSLT